jgi:hypothetical protein
MSQSPQAGQRRTHPAARRLVDIALPPITWSRGHRRAGKIRIGDALGGAAGCRLRALRLRSIAAVDVAPSDAVGLQADRIVRIIRLGPSWRRRRNRRDRQNRQCRNAYRSLLRARRGASDWPVVRSQFTFALWRRPDHLHKLTQAIRSISTASKRSNLSCLRRLAAHEFTRAQGKLKCSRRAADSGGSTTMSFDNGRARNRGVGRRKRPNGNCQIGKSRAGLTVSRPEPQPHNGADATEQHSRIREHVATPDLGN